jgi:copper chaperone CopZ
LGTIIVGFILIALVAAIILNLVKNKKRGKHSCGSGCAHCAMAGACHDRKKNADSDCAVTNLQIDGMMCRMCESHINDAIRNNFSVLSVKSSHKTGVCQIKSKEPLDQERLRQVISETGYKITSIY